LLAKYKVSLLSRDGGTRGARDGVSDCYETDL
jgi:hypothetical protein